MDGLSKLFVELGIRWRRDAFLRTRIALSAIYTGIAAFLLGISSYLLYGSLLGGLRESIDDHVIADPFIRQTLFIHAAALLQARILLLDIILIVFVVLFAYSLTAITLRPIRHARDRERRFLADAAHELRTPLAVMKTEIEIALRKKDISVDMRALLSSNLEEIDALTRLANDLLGLARGNVASVPVVSSVSPRIILERLVENLRMIANEKRVTLTYASEIRDTVTLHAEEGAISRALGNIVHNAIKYTDSGGSVHVSSAVTGKYLTISIADSGVGIPSADIPHVTKAFYRADKSRTSRDGAGLGLAIAYETIALHGGMLKITSEVGKGTTVNVSLPVTIGISFIADSSR